MRGLSVIIPCHQGADTIPVQLRALATQADPPPFEVIIVDNQSTDALRDAVDAQRLSLIASGATEVLIVEASRYSGASYARNVGERYVSFEHLVFCDADDCVSARWLADAALLFRQADAFSGSAVPVPASTFGSDVESLRARIAPKPSTPPILRRQDESVLPILMGGNFGIRRTLFRDLGGFDVALSFAGEDNDLAIRLRASGRPVFSSHAMQIAYRTRDGGRGHRVAARRAASAHVLLCQRYSAFRQSRIVGSGRLLASTAKLPFAAVGMLLWPASRDFDGLLARVASIAGLWLGVVRYRILRRAPRPRLGIGLERRSHQ